MAWERLEGKVREEHMNEASRILGFLRKLLKRDSL
jgi:hypothetical protein